jgi:hypothetical protein
LKKRLVHSAEHISQLSSNPYLGYSERSNLGFLLRAGKTDPSFRKERKDSRRLWGDYTFAGAG